MSWSAEDWDQYRKEFGHDDEIWQKKQHIFENGLTAMVRLELDKNAEDPSWSLWMLVLEPVPDKWTHMRLPEALREKMDDGPYHISICFAFDIDMDWKKKALQHLIDKYSKPFEYTFRVTRFGGGMSAEIDLNNPVCQDIKELHERGYYRNRTIHISL